MAKIFRHPDVEDYFHFFDMEQEALALATKATELYESGQAFILKDFLLDFDKNFLASLEFDDDATKKFKSINFLKQFKQFTFPGASPNTYDDLLRNTFDGNKKRMNHFAEQVRSINNQIDSIIARLFPRYQIEKPSITWRLNETINENLHVDVYNEDLPNHHLRLFVNLDTVPRIWHTSHTLEHILKNSLHLLDEEFVRTSTPGRICHALNFAVFKGFEEAGREGLPKHIVFFDPGEVWIVDSRKVSHQIFYGRKALSVEHAIVNTSMKNPSLHYYEIVNRYRNKFLYNTPGAI
ncbi:MAG: hypothetical protein ABIQ03_04320 [Burkholderiales bacterium]